MGLLHIHAQSYGRFFEVLPDEADNAELAVEELVSYALLELFGEASVDEVCVSFSSASRMGQRDCSIIVQAQCSPDTFMISACSEEYMRAVIANSIYAALREFFGSVTIESIRLEPEFMRTH